MSRRKAAEVELLSPEDPTTRGRKKLVQARHKIEYDAPVSVAVEEDPEGDSEEDLDFVEEEKAQRRKKTFKDEREALQRELDKLGVASVSRLKLSIDKYRHSDSDDSGTLAEKDYCVKYPVTKDHIIHEEYMDQARKYGPGRYWFTLRMDNKIIRQWERQVSAVVTPTGPVIQHINPNDPTSPQVIIAQSPDGQTPQIPMSIKDIMKAQREALKEQLEMAKLMREAYGFAPEQSQQQPRSEEEILSSAILKQPEVIENVVGSVIKRFGGKSNNGSDDEPSVTSVLMKAVENNQLASSIQAFGNVALMIVDRIFPRWGNNNGQAQMATAPLQTIEPVDSQRTTDGRTVVAQEISQGNQSLQPTNGEVNREGGMTPEDQALQLLIEHCRRNIPAEIACDRLISFADAINDQAPHLSIDRYISMFAMMPTDAALEFVKSQPNGEQVVSLPHAQAWCSELQRLIKEEGQEGGEQG